MNESHNGTVYSKDRLLVSRWDDEPLGDEHRDFQQILDDAYDNEARGNLERVCDLLARGKGQPKTHYQEARAERLTARYCIALDDRGATSKRFVGENLRAIAIERMARAAEIAQDIPDWALVAQLTFAESSYCYSSKPYSRRYFRAYQTAKSALDAWLRLEDRVHIDDLYYEFELADALGVRAQMVGKYADAVDGMEIAATVILKLRDRVDPSDKKFLYNQFLLDWDWAALNQARGAVKFAFMRALSARDQALNCTDVRNFGRVNRLIADIALDCIDRDITWKYYETPTLKNVAEAAKDAALEAAEGYGDDPGYVLALLAQGRWLRHTPWWHESGESLKKAEERATPYLEMDPLLHARIEMAWGDEHTFLYQKRRLAARAEKARAYYHSAEKRFHDLEALGLKEIARRRLIRLHKLINSPNPGSRRKRKRFEPPSDPTIPPRN